MSLHAARNALLLVLLPLLLAGCGVLPGKTESTVAYSPSVEIPANGQWPTADWQLVVAKPVTEVMLSGSRIAVRPHGGAELQVLAGARWSDTVPELLQTLIVRAFEDSGHILGVGRQASGVRADFTLTLDLRAFEAVYAGSGAPTAKVVFNAKLLGGPGNRVVASRTFQASEPAGGREAAEVVPAFDRALESAIGELIGWTLEQGAAAQAADPA
jgi:cholesterol transport system auxiliary component